MKSFKPGDVVVIVRNKDIYRKSWDMNPDMTLTIISTDSDPRFIWAKVDASSKTQECFFTADVELKTIANSPLLKALKENDE